MSADFSTQNEVDESLYSRQLYVFGHEAQKKMGSSDVLIIGLQGLGVEAAKNIILAGVRSLCLFDNEIVQIGDLSSQFYLTPSDVGVTTRAQASFSKLSTLNQYVNTHIADESELSESLIAKYKVVVMADRPRAEQLKVNEWCRLHGIKFIYGAAMGLLSTFFADLGNEHVVTDGDGAECLRGLISHVSNGNPGVVTCSDEHRHGLSDGDYVTFEEVEGMEELNSMPPQKVRTRSPYSFTIGDTSSFSPFTGTRGFFNQVKIPFTMSFKSLAEALKTPEFTNDNLFDAAQYQLLINELYQFQASHGRFPSPTDASEATQIVEAVERAAQQAEMEFTETMKADFWKLARASSASIANVTAFAGGILGQEVLKACSGKFTPLQQFMHCSAVESSPDITPSSNLESFAPQNTRYDSYLAVYGSELHAKVTQQSLFLVGAGAIGCEMLKNWALMGVATAPNARITVTDMDTIEKSNLNRQFLFRPSDVGKLKSQAAAAACIAMNSTINITFQSLKVGTDTECVYDDQFWASLSGVYTALDNVEARLFVDSKCVYYGKPLVDSGTLGSKGNTQVIIPGLTESYGSTRDPPEVSFAVCTLKNFPYKIEHTIQWARDYFEGVFKQAFDEAQNYVSKPGYLASLAQQPNAQIPCLETLNQTLVRDLPHSLKDCIVWARRVLDEEFRLNIQQLVYNCPADQITSEGTPFWSGTKRCPDPVMFNPEDPLHLEFVVAAANLRAFNYSIPGIVDENMVKEALADYKPVEFVPKQMKIATTDAEAQEAKETSFVEDHDVTVAKLTQSLPDPSTLKDIHLNPAQFEKDDDSNYHIAFVTACSNLRARCYRIKEVSKHETKFVAGKIIPAIATTTALVTGLVCTEMMKILLQKPVEAYRNTFVNLAIDLMTDSEPSPPEYTVTVLPNGSEYKWSLWDCIMIDQGKELTLREFIEHVEARFEVEMEMVNYGAALLHVSYMPKKSEGRMDLLLSKAIEQITKEPLPSHITYITLDCVMADENGEDIALPPFRVKVRNF